MHRRAHRITVLTTTAVVAASVFFAHPTRAIAASYEELQQRVEEATTAYNDAMANMEQIQVEIDENEGKIAQIEAELPAQRAKAAESLRTLYKMKQSSNGLIDLLLSSENFNELIATVTYLDRIQSKNMTELQALASLNAELQQAEDTLSARKAQADQEVERAYQAQQDAVAAREEVVQHAIAQAAAEQAEAEAALAQAQQEAAAGQTFTTASGQQAPISVPETTPTPAEAEEESNSSSSDSSSSDSSSSDSSSSDSQGQSEENNVTPTLSERDAFVAKWAPRIDAYMSGYPLAGYGTTFAEAAWDYGVDPRWSPAISCIESTKGLYCFKSHNAWGWGSSSWDDWDSAIRAHVSGLASIYGYTITTEAAQMYCPPTWQAWYSSVSAEMASI